MNWEIEYRDRVDYSDPTGRHPRLLVEIGVGSKPPLQIEAVLDSGCEYTLVDGDLLRPLGFDPPSSPDTNKDPAAMYFSSASGGGVVGYLFDCTLTVVNTHVQHSVFLYGSLSPISRNLIGRDFFNRTVVGFHDAKANIFLDSLEDRLSAPIKSVSGTTMYGVR